MAYGDRTTFLQRAYAEYCTDGPEHYPLSLVFAYGEPKTGRRNEPGFRWNRIPGVSAALLRGITSDTRIGDNHLPDRPNEPDENEDESKPIGFHPNGITIYAINRPEVPVDLDYFQVGIEALQDLRAFILRQTVIRPEDNPQSAPLS